MARHNTLIDNIFKNRHIYKILIEIFEIENIVHFVSKIWYSISKKVYCV